MEDIIDFENLKNLAKKAIRSSVEALNKAHSPERMCAYALCTDDGVMTIFHVACTDEWLSDKGSLEDYQFPTEWEYSDGESCFNEVYDLLMERCDKQYDEEYEDKFEEIVEQSFNSLTAALLELKNEGFFNESTYLTIQSTDPSETMMNRAAKSILKLNSKNVANKWAAWANEYN